jgi:hypothetical protein
MQHIVIESAHGCVTAYIGPFPSQCQALSYIESKEGKTSFQYLYRSLLIPEYMPEPIHATPRIES